jgi:hypothetical protein
MTASKQMPRAVADDLLRSCSWHAEKLLRKRGHFGTVLFLAQHADSSRERMFERFCNAAPDSATDSEVLVELAADVAADFAESGVTRFAVAYLCKRVTVIKPVDPNSPMKPSTTRKQGVAIELQSANEHVSIFREIIRPPRGKPVLGAPSVLDESAVASSPYSGVLQRAAGAAGVVLW